MASIPTDIPYVAAASLSSSDAEPSRPQDAPETAPEPVKLRRRKPGLHRVSNKGRALRRARFLEAYMANGYNGAAAAEAVGYRKGRSAYLAGYEFLKELAATGELAAVARQRGEAAGLETERTLREVARVAYADPRRLFDADGKPIPLHELPEEVAATIASYEVWPNGRVKVKFWSKVEALDRAMRHAGLYERDNKQLQPNLSLQVILVDPPQRPTDSGDKSASLSEGAPRIETAGAPHNTGSLCGYPGR
jgi:hypothetical protein